jgi:hypothetical protein
MNAEEAFMDDAEVTAMSQVLKALAPLEEDAAHRVLRWACERFSLTVGRKHPPSLAGAGQDAETSEARQFSDLPSLFAAADPATEADKVLVASYWFQVCQNNESLDGLRINRELKHLGHPVTNVTRAFDSLMSRQPKLAMQIRKSGPSRQARKQYRLTHEGVRRVQEMLANEYRAE